MLIAPGCKAAAMKSPSALGRSVLVYLGLAQGPETSSPIPREIARRLMIISGLGLLLVVSGGVLLFAGQSPLWVAFSGPGAILLFASRGLEKRTRRRLGSSRSS